MKDSTEKCNCSVITLHHGTVVVSRRWKYYNLRFESFVKKYIAEKSQKISFGFGKSPKTFYLCSALERHPCTLWANRIVLWCNGSTAVFGSACLGSNPGKTTFLVAKSLKNQRFSGFSLPILSPVGLHIAWRGDVQLGMKSCFFWFQCLFCIEPFSSFVTLINFVSPS